MGKWSNKVLNDRFVREAKRLDYVSRAAFKLIDIQKKHQVIKRGSYVLDLGCAPGSWLQVACKELGSRKHGGLVVGVDIQDFELPKAHIDERVRTVKADILSVDPLTFMEFAPQRSLELTETALDLSTGRIALPNEPLLSTAIRVGILKQGGNLVMKVFEGAGTNEFVKSTRQHFQEVLRMRPEAVRKASREFYLICKNRRSTKQ